MTSSNQPAHVALLRALAQERYTPAWRPAVAPNYMAAGTWPGLVARGNLNLNARPIVHNPDGSISTVRSITVGVDGGHFVLLPTVVGGRVVSNDQAIQHWRQTGQHLGVFNSEHAADHYAQNLHLAQASQYGGSR